MRNNKKKKTKSTSRRLYFNTGGQIPQQGLEQAGQVGQYDDVIGQGLNMAVPGAGTAVTALSGIGRSIEQSGSSDASMLAADMINPLSGLDAAMSGNFKEATPWGFMEKGKRLRKERAEAKEKALQANYDQDLKRSGQVLANYNTQGTGNFALGGRLDAVSPDAVEVKANGPGTDTVNIGIANVDNKEIIDNQKRVFSDDLKMGSGKSYANEAKKLEKQKMDGYPEANSLLERKLDKLFQQQEMSKAPELAQGGKMNYADGGTLARKPLSNAFMEQYLPMVPGQQAAMPQPLQSRGVGSAGQLMSANIQGASEPSLAGQTTQGIGLQGTSLPTNIGGQALPSIQGGMLNPNQGSKLQGIGLAEVDNYMPLIPKGVDPSGAAIPSAPAAAPAAGGGINANAIANIAGTFGSNMINQALISKTPEAPAARLINPVSLDRVNDRARQASLNRQSVLTRRANNMNTAQSTNANAMNAMTKAQELQASNQLADQTNRANIGIGNQESAMNMRIDAMNTGALSQADAERVARENAMNTQTSQNYADVANKFMMGRAEQNAMTLDQTRLALLKKQYEDTGIYDRNIEEYLKSLGVDINRKVSGKG